MKVHAFRCVRTSICIMPSWSFVVVFDLVSPPPWTRKKCSLTKSSFHYNFIQELGFYTLQKGDTITIKSSFTRKLQQARKKCISRLQ